MDINSDLGESFGAWRMGDDAAMLQVVTSANIACGFHAGDPAGILQTLRGAVERGVIVGAHVGYPDLVGFGRRGLRGGWTRRRARRRGRAGSAGMARTAHRARRARRGR